MSSLTSLLGGSYGTGLTGLSGLGTTGLGTTGLGTSGLGGGMGLTDYTQTGVPAAGGGYAYPPGSEMCQFMDSINNTTAQACMSPDGSEDVMTWANQLQQEAQMQGFYSDGTGTTGTTGLSSGLGGLTGGSTGTSSLPQMMEMLMSMFSSLMGGSGMGTSSLGASQYGTTTSQYDPSSLYTNSATSGIDSYYSS